MPALMRRDERVVEHGALPQRDEKHHPHVAVPVLADGDRFAHLGHLLHLGVDLGGADAHAAGIERGVGAAVDDEAAGGRDLREVALAPDAGEALEIGGAVAGAVRVVPEAERHRRKGRGADELALDAGRRRAALGVAHLDREPEARSLDLAAVHRPGRVAEHEAGEDVGAARDRGEVQVGLHRLVDEVEGLRRQRRAGREHRPEAREIVAGRAA